MLRTSAVGIPGIQGPGVTGTQGIGVKTPAAAAVAAATVGLAIELHMPKGGILTMGAWSMMLAAGVPSSKIVLGSTTMSVAGAAPNVHCSVAPMRTRRGIVFCRRTGLLTRPRLQNRAY